MTLIFLHITIAPFISYFMMLLWAALIGDTFGTEDGMFTEWVICIQIYIAIVLLYNLKKVLIKYE